MKEQDRTREAIALLKQSTNGSPETFKALTDNIHTFTELINELDSNQPFTELKTKSALGTFDKLQKTTAYLDSQIEHSFLTRFGIAGINYSNLE